jgi:hypothetical protein
LVGEPIAFVVSRCGGIIVPERENNFQRATIARFRRTRSRLQVSIIETARLHGKVHQHYVASLGSIPPDPSPHDRIAFWQRVNQKLAKLANRIDAATQAKLRGEIHGRIPMPSIQDQREVQQANAQADATCWKALEYLSSADAKGHRAMASKAANTAAEVEARAAQAKQNAEAATDRLAKLARGEEISGGLGRPAEIDAVLRAEGWTKADFRRMSSLGEISVNEFETMLLPRLRQASDRAVVNAVWRETARRRLRRPEDAEG